MTDKLAFVRHMIGDDKWYEASRDGYSVLRAGPFVLKVTKTYRIGSPWSVLVENQNGERVDVCIVNGTTNETAQNAAIDLLAKHILAGNGVVLSPWTVYHDYCAMRFVEGTDPADVANRVAFIEKTPRVRVAAFDHNSKADDCHNWWCGPRGSSGSDNAAQDQTYGFYPLSRQWCDEQLVALGYVLTGSAP